MELAGRQERQRDDESQGEQTKLILCLRPRLAPAAGPAEGRGVTGDAHPGWSCWPDSSGAATGRHRPRGRPDSRAASAGDGQERRGGGRDGDGGRRGVGETGEEELAT